MWGFFCESRKTEAERKQTIENWRKTYFPLQCGKNSTLQCYSCPSTDFRLPLSDYDISISSSPTFCFFPPIQISRLPHHYTLLSTTAVHSVQQEKDTNSHLWGTKLGKSTCSLTKCMRMATHFCVMIQKKALWAKEGASWAGLLALSTKTDNYLLLNRWWNKLQERAWNRKSTLMLGIII